MSVSFYLPELELENPKSNRDEVQLNVRRSVKKN